MRNVRVFLSRSQWRFTGIRSYEIKPRPRAVTRLADGDLVAFRSEAFDKALPALMPRRNFENIPAIQKWFTTDLNSNDRDAVAMLNNDYLSSHGWAIVPLEITNDKTGTFSIVHEPLMSFLKHVREQESGQTSMYLAQASIADLPESLAQDLPTPDIVLKAGRGDVYGSSIWLGLAPTYTPLHRDPNPNLFVQLAGRKRLRLLPPAVGRDLFMHVQALIGGTADASFRGMEMMAGRERQVLEQLVWDSQGTSPTDTWASDMSECEVTAGDGLFIPKGWWHSVKGVGERTMIGSVNWWFR